MVEPLKVFIDSNGQVHKLENLNRVLNKVADDWEQIGLSIKEQNLYADHVTNETKEKELQKHLNTANDIRKGIVSSFTIWQRINTELTGNCVALLS